MIQSNRNSHEEIADRLADTAGVRKALKQAASETIETADVQTPYLAFDYQVGDRVTSSPESRDLLGCRIDNRGVSWIERVQMDFEKQCTNLKIVRQRNRLNA